MSPCPVSRYPGQRDAGPTLFLFLETGDNVACLCSIGHHDTTPRQVSTTSQNPKANRDGTTTRGKPRASASGNPSRPGECLVGRTAASVMPLLRRASGIVAVKLSGQDVPMVPCRMTMSVGYNSTRASWQRGPTILAPRDAEAISPLIYAFPRTRGPHKCPVPHGGCEPGTHAKHHVRPKIAEHGFPEPLFERARFIAALDRRRPKLAGLRGGYRHNCNGATLVLARLLTVKVWA